MPPMNAAVGSPGAPERHAFEPLSTHSDEKLDACIRRFRRQFGIMLFTSQAVLIAILTLLFLLTD